MDLEYKLSILSKFNLKKYKDNEIEIEFDNTFFKEKQDLDQEQETFEEEKKQYLKAIYDGKSDEPTDI